MKTRKTVRKPARVVARVVSTARRPAKKLPVAKRVVPSVPVEDARRVVVVPLDPWLHCGPDTSVTELWRVKEMVGRLTTYHLVFFDKHGWYCEHGRGCSAVADVRRGHSGDARAQGIIPGQSARQDKIER